MSNRLSHSKPAPPPRGAPWKARSCGWVNRRSSGIKLEGLTTPSVISMVTETDPVVATLPQPQIEEEEVKTDFSTGNDRRRQRMTRRPMDKLLSTKYRTRLGTWNVRKLYQTGRCAQVAAEMNRYEMNSLLRHGVINSVFIYIPKVWCLAKQWVFFFPRVSSSRYLKTNSVFPREQRLSDLLYIQRMKTNKQTNKQKTSK